MSLPTIVIGAGGHARVLIDALRCNSVPILGIADADLKKKGLLILGIRVIGDDQSVFEFSPDSVELVNGIGSVGPPVKRKYIYDFFKMKGYAFASVIHPSCVIGADTRICEGVQMMAGSIIQPSCNIEFNAIVNTGASVDHDCVIGAHVHIAPGVTLSGGVLVGEGAHVGTGATVIQGVRIGAWSLVAAGAVVVDDVKERVAVKGVPAR